MQSKRPPPADLAGALRQLQEQLAVCVTLLEEAALYLVAYTPQQELPGHMLHGRHLHRDILAVVEAYRHDDCRTVGREEETMEATLLTYCTLCDTNQTMRPNLVLRYWQGAWVCTDCLEELDALTTESLPPEAHP